MAPTTQGERDAYAAFAQQVATRYKGKFAAYEIWNEPNLDQFWAPTPNIMHYAALFKGASAAIRQVDTTTPIITGGTGGAGSAPDIDSLTFVTGLYDNGCQSYLDGIAVHPYPNLDGTPLPNGELAKAIQIRSLMDQRGDQDKLLWGTETGVPTAGQYGTVTEAEQAALIPQIYDIWRTRITNRGPLFWYTLWDSDAANNDRESYFGIIRPDGSDKPGFAAIKTMTYQPAPLPSVSLKGDVVERSYTRVYTLTGMQTGSTGDPAANASRLQSVLNGALAGDCILVPKGLYRLGTSVTFSVAGVTRKGTGATREDVVFESTNEMRALFMITADDIHLYNFTKRVYGSTRSSQGQSGEGNIWVQGRKKVSSCKIF